MDSWPIKPSRGGLFGVVCAAGAVLLGLIALLLAVRQPLGPPALLLILLATALIGSGAALATLAAAFFLLTYRFAPGAFVVRWAGRDETLPLDEVEGVYAGQRVGELRRVRGVSWPGYHVGLVRSRSLGTLRAYCTDRRVDDLTIVVTPSRTLVLTPTDPPGFRRELVRRIEGSEGLIPSEHAARTADSAGWPHPLLVAVVAASLALLTATLAAGISGQAALSEVIPLADVLSWRPSGSSPRSAIYNLPLLGALLLALNLGLAFRLRRREPAAAALLCGSGLLIQAVVLFSALRLLP